MLCWYSHGLFISTSMDKGQQVVTGWVKSKGDGSEIFDVLILTLVLSCIALLQIKRKFYGHYGDYGHFSTIGKSIKKYF